MIKTKTPRAEPVLDVARLAEPPPPNAHETLKLFRVNLELIREWYHRTPGTGQELGHLVVGELTMANTLAALDAALEGKRWQAPN